MRHHNNIGGMGRGRLILSLLFIPMLLVPFAARAAEGKRFAVVVGVGQYTDKDVPALRFAKADAEMFYEFLTDPNGGGFPKQNVKLLTDSEATQVTVRSALGTWLARNAMKEDTVVIYYAGHGAPEVDPSGESTDGFTKYLVPYDANPKDLFATGIPMKEVETIFKRIESDRVVFITDTCYSGSAGGRTFSFTPAGRALNIQYDFIEQLTQGEGRVVIASADANEVALEMEDLGHGLFTYHLVEGLKGKADKDRDGHVTIDEAYKYAYKRVVKESRSIGGNQHPVFKGSVTGEIVLASLGSTEGIRAKPKPKARISVTVDQPGVRVKVNGEEIGVSKKADEVLVAEVAPGSHRVEANDSSGRAFKRDLTVNKNQEQSIIITFGGRSDSRGRRPMAKYYVGGGLGIVGLGSGIYSLVSFLNTDMGDKKSDDLAQVRRWEDERSASLVQGSVFLGIAALSIGFGAYTAFAERPFGLSLSKGGLNLSSDPRATSNEPRAFSLIPWGSHEAAGASLSLALEPDGLPSFVRRGWGR